jgi:hypothetical protein
MRYQIGQRVPFIHFNIENSITPQWFTKPYLYNENKILKTTIVVMECIEHHKVPWEYDTDNECKYDGYIFKNNENIWYNQYPKASYGQISSEQDSIISIHYEDNEKYKCENEDELFEMYDLKSFLQLLLRGISINKQIKKEAQEYIEKLESLVNDISKQLKDEFSIDLIIKPRVFEGREVANWFNVEFDMTK